MDNETKPEVPVPAPKKPRPSRAVKKAKAKKPAKRKVVKTKRDRSKPLKVRPAVVERSARIDLRLTKAEKAKLAAKAKASRRTITSILSELIEKMR